MIVEKNDNEILIKIQGDIDISMLQKMINYIRFTEIKSGSKASEKDIEDLSLSAKSNSWLKLKKSVLP